jgi:EpsI family protein
MTRVHARCLAVGLAMLAAAALAFAMTPRTRMADEAHRVDYEQLIPTSFGEWRLDTSLAPVEVPPDVKAQLERFYSQTVSRTYVNRAGERVMLSIAYGDSQSRSLQVHRPEVCYVAQGFSVSDLVRASLDTAAATIPVMNLVARQGARNEPITYWVRFGDDVVRGNVEQGIARLRYGLTGRIPDGLLVRVSTISRNPDAAYKSHAEFVAALIAAIPDADRWQLIGRGT